MHIDMLFADVQSLHCCTVSNVVSMLRSNVYQCVLCTQLLCNCLVLSSSCTERRLWKCWMSAHHCFLILQLYTVFYISLIAFILASFSVVF